MLIEGSTRPLTTPCDMKYPEGVRAARDVPSAPAAAHRAQAQVCVSERGTLRNAAHMASSRRVADLVDERADRRASTLAILPGHHLVPHARCAPCSWPNCSDTAVLVQTRKAV
jgi:hypothetical protein